MGEPRCGQVHLAQVGVQFAGAQQVHLQFRGLDEILPGHPDTDDGNRCQKADDKPQPEIPQGRRAERLSGHGDRQTMQPAFLGQFLVLLLIHPKRSSEPWPASTVPWAFGPFGCVRRRAVCGHAVGRAWETRIVRPGLAAFESSLDIANNIRRIPSRQNDCRAIGLAFGCYTRTQIDQVHQGDTPVIPLFTLLCRIHCLEIKGFARKGHHIARGI